VSHGLGIAEGLETALKVRARGWRTIWALGSAGAIERFAPLAGVEALTIFADNDESGRGIAAARACAGRWNDAGAETFIRMPRTTGADWADII
jgi:putative DNA primase/helicase